MINTKVLLDFDDLVIEPAINSTIHSRSECNCFYSDGMLPIFTAPMDTVVDHKNSIDFINNKINVIHPRMDNQEIPMVSCNKFEWYSYGLTDFQRIFLKEKNEVVNNPNAIFYVLLDVANGHMDSILEATRDAKKLYGDSLILMVGNVANPSTFIQLARAGADYIRIGIGNGGGCLTTEQTGVGYPMASLIEKCAFQKNYHNLNTKIVADGGMKKYADIIKALALGADYVMLGTILNKTLESCGEEYVKVNDAYVPIATYDQWVKDRYIVGVGEDDEFKKLRLIYDGILYKKFRGMSTKEVQAKWGRDPKTSEGVIKYQKVEYTLQGWVDNFTHYLKSAMSYTCSYDLNEFKTQTILNQITNNAYKRFNK